MTFPATLETPGSQSRPPSDAALLERIAAGDIRALWELCARHAAALRAVAFSILRDASEAELVVQSVFQDVRYEAARFDPAHFPVLSWLTENTRDAALRAHPHPHTHPAAAAS
jgi:RNA polymerase sigma-70 factor (ECF subfamily)